MFASTFVAYLLVFFLFIGIVIAVADVLLELLGDKYRADEYKIDV